MFIAVSCISKTKKIFLFFLFNSIHRFFIDYYYSHLSKIILERMVRMYFNVKVFINNMEVDSADLPDYEIKCPAIDRIINDIIDRATEDSNIDDKAS